MRSVVVTAVAFGIADLLYELPFLAAGVYTYYGQQPFAILTFPLHWLVMNSAVPVITGFIMYWADRLSTTEQGRAVAVFASPILSGGCAPRREASRLAARDRNHRVDGLLHRAVGPAELMEHGRC